MSNTQTIAKNSAWYALENAVSFLVTLFSSIAIARTLGPSQMGYIVYVNWLSGVVGSLGGIGIPVTTRKYMAEFLGSGDRGTARFIYFRTLILQSVMATLATGGIVFWIVRTAPLEYQFAALCIGVSIWPAMVNSISAQANVAREEMGANLPASIVSMIVFFLGIAGTVVFKWGVLGVGAATLAMRITDFLIRLLPTLRRILAWDRTHVIPPGLSRRMVAFAWQSVAIMLLGLIVWERSEFLLLKNFCADIRQIAFYSIAFSMADRLLLPSMVFGSAAGTTIYAQYGRDRSRIPEIAASTMRYLALTAIPLHMIFGALAAPALLLLYGHQYNGAVTVVTLAPILCMPKAFIAPAQDLLQSHERQSYVIATTIFAGAIDIGVAWWLVRSHGAVGACIGSGVAQFAAVTVLWFAVIRFYRVRLPWRMIANITLFSILAAMAARFITIQVSPLWALLGGSAAAFTVFSILLYTMRVLEPRDCERLNLLTDRFPKSIARPLQFILSKLARNDRSDVSPVGV